MLQNTDDLNDADISACSDTALPLNADNTSSAQFSNEFTGTTVVEPDLYCQLADYDELPYVLCENVPQYSKMPFMSHVRCCPSDLKCDIENVSNDSIANSFSIGPLNDEIISEMNISDNNLRSKANEVEDSSHWHGNNLLQNSINDDQNKISGCCELCVNTNSDFPNTLPSGEKLNVLVYVEKTVINNQPKGPVSCAPSCNYFEECICKYKNDAVCTSNGGSGTSVVISPDTDPIRNTDNHLLETDVAEIFKQNHQSIPNEIGVSNNAHSLNNIVTTKAFILNEDKICTNTSVPNESEMSSDIAILNENEALICVNDNEIVNVSMQEINKFTAEPSVANNMPTGSNILNKSGICTPTNVLNKNTSYFKVAVLNEDKVLDNNVILNENEVSACTVRNESKIAMDATVLSKNKMLANKTVSQETKPVDNNVSNDKVILTGPIILNKCDFLANINIPRETDTIANDNYLNANDLKACFASEIDFTIPSDTLPKPVDFSVNDTKDMCKATTYPNESLLSSVIGFSDESKEAAKTTVTIEENAFISCAFPLDNNNITESNALPKDNILLARFDTSNRSVLASEIRSTVNNPNVNKCFRINYPSEGENVLEKEEIKNDVISDINEDDYRLDINSSNTGLLSQNTLLEPIKADNYEEYINCVPSVPALLVTEMDENDTFLNDYHSPVRSELDMTEINSNENDQYFVIEETITETEVELVETYNDGIGNSKNNMEDNVEDKLLMYDDKNESANYQNIFINFDDESINDRNEFVQDRNNLINDERKVLINLENKQITDGSNFINDKNSCNKLENDALVKLKKERYPTHAYDCENKRIINSLLNKSRHDCTNAYGQNWQNFQLEKCCDLCSIPSNNIYTETRSTTYPSVLPENGIEIQNTNIKHLHSTLPKICTNYSINKSLDKPEIAQQQSFFLFVDAKNDVADSDLSLNNGDWGGEVASSVEDPQYLERLRANDSVDPPLSLSNVYFQQTKSASATTKEELSGPNSKYYTSLSRLFHSTQPRPPPMKQCKEDVNEKMHENIITSHNMHVYSKEDVDPDDVSSCDSLNGVKLHADGNMSDDSLS